MVSQAWSNSQNEIIDRLQEKICQLWVGHVLGHFPIIRGHILRQRSNFAFGRRECIDAIGDGVPEVIHGSRVVSLPGTGDTVRGFSAPDLIVEDEAGFVEDSFYTAIRPMLATSGGQPGCRP